ncbi:YhgE/Pip domain-containing protein [Lactiplantibacillus songbeiensis]|uniref:YhgE/Pip family protein n=1 Tax=Lactiplantibacillus songbeiensis TaxID=2559920 RepID=A0ABW4BYM2_9LACO|nr:YhgE/Pip domain-containing protein [Lactiplantibacillus songbeiensis]
MISGEWRAIRHSKILWISVSVMILIPFLYSVFFLTSVWDPYGDTKHLPVAVVNNDKPINYQGKRFAVGEELIKNLKKNDQLGWHFVSADKAEQGMATHKYYTVVTIPSNFSQHATTVTSKNPKRMKLHYSTNASLNYIAKVISDAGATQLNQNVRAAVTKAYALTMFKQVKTAGEGFSKAAKGASQLKDGTVVLQSGLKTYTTGVHTLKNGTTELNTKVKQMPAGMKKLVDGSSALKTGLDTLNGSTGALASGVNKLSDGSNQVTSGLGTLNSSTGALSDGVVKLADGSKALKVGVVTYTNGVYTLSTGIRTLNSKTGALSSGVTALTTGSKTLKTGVATYTSGVDTVNSKLKDLNSGAQTLNGGLTQLKNQSGALTSGAGQLVTGTTALTEKFAALQDGSNKVTTGLGALHDGMTSEENQKQIVSLQQGMAGMAEQLKQIQAKLAGMQNAGTSAQATKIVSDMQTHANQLASGATNTSTTGSSSDVTSQINAKIESIKGSSKLTDAQVSAIETALKGVGQKDSSNNAAPASNVTAANALKADAANLQKTIAASPVAATPTASLTDSFGQLQDGVNTLIDSINTAADNVQALQVGSQNVSNGMVGVNKQIIEPLTAGTTALQSQVPDLINGVTQLADGGSTLANGSSQLSAGTQQIANNSKALNTGASQLTTGLTTLNGQVPALVKGVSDLNAGGKKLTANSPALVNGSSQLASGTAQLNAQVPTLVSGVSQLFNGSKQVSGGLTTLNGQVPALSSGVQKLDSGAGQLNGGLQTLNGSTGQLVTGVQQLADGADQLDANSPKLLSGTKKLKNGNGTLAKSLQSGADTVNATPLKNANAQMFATPSKLTHSNYSYVPNYGHALAPYVLSLALYVGAIVFNFAYPIRRMSDDDGTATEWFLSKLAVGVPVAILMAIIECIALLIVGLKPISMAGYFTTAIMIALASMFIVMFLSMLLDNPGRFLAMVLLMLQLGGSGGTFPMEITNHFFNVIHPYLPLTYSILAFRESLTGGWGTGTFVSSIAMLALFAIVALGLLWVSMVFLKKHNMQEPAEAPIQMKAGK